MSSNKIKSFAALQDVISNPRLSVASVCKAIDECITCNWDNLWGHVSPF